jgi:aspartyl protease family protein
MLVDTGASGTVLTQQVAAALGITPIGKMKANTPSDKGVEMFVGRIASIEVAGAVVKNTLVAVAPALDTGLLGENFFKLYDVTVKENVVEFRPRQR